MHPPLAKFLLDKVAIKLPSISTGKILLSVPVCVCVCVGLPAGRARLPMVRSTSNKAFISRKHPRPAKIWVGSWRGREQRWREDFNLGLDWSKFTCFYTKEELSIQLSCCWTGSVTNPDLASKISAIKTHLWCPAQCIKTKSMLLPRWTGEWFGLTSEQLQMSQAWRDLKNQ